MTNQTRIVFMGTPEFAVPTLDALAAKYTLAGVVTQPDRPAGRGRAPHPSAVKQAALDLDLPIFQPESLRDPDAVQHLHDWEPSVIVVAAFGQILRADVLDLAPHGCLNIHASLLPRWRGAAPINYAIWTGDEESGVTLMRMDAGLDTGPILAQRSVRIDARETAASLHDRLSMLGAALLVEILPDYLSGDLTPRPQPEAGVTLAPSLDKAAGRIDWTQTAVEIDRQVRALNPWPGTYTHFDDQRLKILDGAPRKGKGAGLPPGVVVAPYDGLAVVTGEGLFMLERVQPPGGKPMLAQAFANGHPDFMSAQLG